MTLAYGQAYVEPGYTAADCKNVNLTAAVKITNNVNVQVPGLYTINYKVTDTAGLEGWAYRTVTVNKQPVVVVPPQAPKITVNGSNPIVLHQTSATPYKEQSARAVDQDGTNLSNLVKVTGNLNRNVAGTYTLTYSVTSPKTGLSATTTRNVRIVSPTEKKDPRTKYGLSSQAKQGAKITHTGITSNAIGFMDLKVSSIDKNMTITAELVNTATKKAVLKDTFTAAGTKQYRIDKSKYELVVTIVKANGNSKYNIELLMPETEATLYYADVEIPLTFIGPPKIAPIGSNPIILHLNGTPYFEQGARAVDYDGENISDRVEIFGTPDTSVPETYLVIYKVTNDLGMASYTTREVWILAPNEEGEYLFDEVPLDADGDFTGAGDTYSAIFGESDAREWKKVTNTEGIVLYIPDKEQPMDTYLEAVTDQVAMAASPFDGDAYTVVSGDNLWKVSQKLYGNGNRWHEIYEMNKGTIGGDPRVLKVGQVLKLQAN